MARVRTEGDRSRLRPTRFAAATAGRAGARLRRLALGLMLAAGGTVCAAATDAGAPEVREFEPVSVPMTVRQVSPHCYYVLGRAGAVSQQNQGFNSNAGFIVTGAGVIVFDILGTPALGKHLLELIEKTTSQPIRLVVLSHYHADHFYGAQAFVGPGVEVWAHELVRDYLASDAPAARLAERKQSLRPWVNEKSRIVVPTRFLGEDTRFSMGDLHLRIVHVGPAHTPEDLMLFVDEDKVLFAGDLVFTGRIPFVADADVSSWIEALKHILALDPAIVVSGHGLYSTDAAADLTQTRDYLVYLHDQIEAAFDEGLDFDAAYRRIDWSRFSTLPAFEEANRRNAYQAYLNIERDALKEVKQKAK